MVWLILLTVLMGIVATYWLGTNLGFLGALLGILLTPIVIGVAVAIEERTRRRIGFGDRSAHFDQNKPQMANYTDATGLGDWVSAYGDKPSRNSTPPGVKVDDATGLRDFLGSGQEKADEQRSASDGEHPDQQSEGDRAADPEQRGG